MTFDDLRVAGLKVSGARRLEACMKPGGEVYNQLVVSGRLVPTLAEPPKHAGLPNNSNPNDGSSVSDITGSSSSGNTKFTAVRVPQRVRERVEHVAPQLYEQDRLAEMRHQDFYEL